MKKFMKEFKEFALRGNVLGLAVGVIIGGAFQGIVTAFIDDLIAPVLGMIVPGDGGLNALQFTVLGSTFLVGDFIAHVIDFILMALVVFFIVKGINKLMDHGKKKEEESPAEKTCPYCKSSISIEAVRCPHCTSDLSSEE